MEITRPTQPQNEHPAEELRGPVLKVVGLGGGGGNAIDRMIELGVDGVEYIAANTDKQSLLKSLAPTRVQLGPELTRGLGAGGDPEIGYNAAQESRRELEAVLKGADMVFLTAGMGGGTGTGAIAVAAEAARAVGAVTIAVVTTPFNFEMGTRQKNAQQGLNWLQPHTDTLIAIPNDRLLYVAPQDLPLETAFRLADDVLRQAVQGIAELVTQPGLINVDFAHVRNMMKRGGGALMAIGQGRGPQKVEQAIEQALNHPLLESVALDDAAGLIANFSGGDDLSLFEVGEAVKRLNEMTGTEIDLVMGITRDERMTERAQVILIVTGLGAPALEDVAPGITRNGIAGAVVPHAPNVASQADQRAETEPTLTQVDEPKDRMPTAQLNNLDIPAFMRKRARQKIELENEN